MQTEPNSSAMPPPSLSLWLFSTVVSISVAVACRTERPPPLPSATLSAIVQPMNVGCAPCSIETPAPSGPVLPEIVQRTNVGLEFDPTQKTPRPWLNSPPLPVMTQSSNVTLVVWHETPRSSNPVMTQSRIVTSPGFTPRTPMLVIIGTVVIVNPSTTEAGAPGLASSTTPSEPPCASIVVTCGPPLERTDTPGGTVMLSWYVPGATTTSSPADAAPIPSLIVGWSAGTLMMSAAQAPPLSRSAPIGASLMIMTESPRVQIRTGDYRTGPRAQTKNPAWARGSHGSFTMNGCYALMTRPSLASAASRTLSCIVGCACTVTISSSLVASSRRARLSSAISSVA